MSDEAPSPAHRVLIIDDEAAICRIVARALVRNGFDAASVSRVAEVEPCLKAGTFEVILLDRSVGSENGGSLLPALREHAPGAKILFFTGEFVSPEEIAEVDGVVQKPINGKELADTIRRLF